MHGPFVITIGRQLASGGRQIGKILAEKFDIPYYDKEILSLAAEESGLGHNVFERNDERKGIIRSIFGAFSPMLSTGGDFYNNQLSEENLFAVQSRVIQKIASERSCIFIGRASDYILRDHPRHCRIFIAAEMSDRISCVMQREHLDRKRAMEFIERADERRAGYYNFYATGSWGNADTYDLCINSSVLGYERTAETIRQFAIEKLHLGNLYGGVPTDVF